MLKFIRIITALCACTSFAAVQPADIFTDYTVLQQNEPVRIWGTAAPGEGVTVQFAGQEKNTVTGDDGKWQVTLDPMSASSEPRDMVFVSSIGNQKSAISNVVVGEVWLAGGQSNMASTMRSYSKVSQPDIDRANDPLLRMVTIPRLDFAGQNSDRPQWQKVDPQNVAGFSASAYYFARNLREKMNIPVGIVACSVGATPAEAWMSRQTLEKSPDLKRILDAYEAQYRKEFSNEKDYRQQYEKFVLAEKEYLKIRKGPRPQPPMGPLNHKRPCGLHETMLTQTIPYTVRGVIWYQGENNATTKNGFHYRTVFPALIQEWREEFKNETLPFLFVQLATFGPVTDDAPYWPELRDAQSWTEDHVKNTGMIVLVDGGEIDNIHPHSKDKAGYRLSLLARNMVYGEKNLICRGPRLKEAACKDETIELSFTDTGSGMVLKPEADSAFEICGADKKYVPAEAKLADGKIIVSAKGITHPQHVRYGWKKWFVPTLFNAEGLPASPFRTDDFPPVTKDRYYLDGQN
jgi:sialate O-acetylesterase